MKTGMIKLVLSMTLVMVLAACGEKPSEQSQSFQQAESDSSSIIGGANSTAQFQKDNGVVGLLMVFENSLGQQGSSTCTASVIAPKVAVTAAHCLVLPRGAQLVAALLVLDTDFTKVIEELNNNDLSHVRVITKAKRHENYLNGRGTNNDIGLIGFDDALPADFKLAQLAGAQTARTLRKGTAVTLSGYGVDNYKLQKDPVTGRLTPSGSGDGLLRQIDGIRVLSLTATGEEITLDQSQGRGACHGDSGGPAYVKDAVSGKNILVGVTSRGTNPQGLCDRQAIYTGVMGYAQWIANGVKELSAVAPKVAAPATKPTQTQASR